MLSQNMFSHLGVFRRSLVEAIGGFREGYGGSQDYDLVLRAAARTRPARIRHIPHVLYHWRATSGSGRAGTGGKALRDRARAPGDRRPPRGAGRRRRSPPRAFPELSPRALRAACAAAGQRDHSDAD
jgi:hypothetical protein